MLGLSVASIVGAQLEAAAVLRDQVERMVFAPPAARVYNPLFYAWEAFAEYVARYGAAKKRVLFLGMNPGPWGMAQTGVPFGEVSIVRNWLKISAPVGRPRDEHPKYPVDGYSCKRSEVSGRRLWGLFKDRFGSAGSFFQEHFVVNYCPLLFIETSQRKGSGGTEEGGRNLTPDKLPPSQRKDLYEACDAHLRTLVEILAPRYLVGVGNFAAARASEALAGTVTVSKILHPSPASPKSNSDWSGEATRQLTELGIWGP
jgi:single-strand selective monofunctional uracil DNA glycosylase